MEKHGRLIDNKMYPNAALDGRRSTDDYDEMKPIRITRDDAVDYERGAEAGSIKNLKIKQEVEKGGWSMEGDEQDARGDAGIDAPETTAGGALSEDFEFDDSIVLVDPAAGFLDPNNLKEPLKGFTDADEHDLFPLIDAQSLYLFKIVQNAEKRLCRRSEKILINHKLPVPIPRSKLLFPEGGPRICLRIFDTKHQNCEEVLGGSILSVAATSNGPSGHNEVPEWLRATIARNAFSPERLAMLRIPLTKGWRRETVLRSTISQGRKLGDVFYYSPGGIKFRSWNQIELYLRNNPELEVTSSMFSFAKSQVSCDPKQETVRQAIVQKYQTGNVALPFLQDVYYGPSSTSTRESYVDKHPELEDEQNKCSAAERGDTNAGRRSIQLPIQYPADHSDLYSENKTELSGKANQREELNCCKMEMGMLPINYPYGRENSDYQAIGISGFPTAEDRDGKRRGRPPKPGGAKGLLAHAEAPKAPKSTLGSEEDDGVLFSAFVKFGHFMDKMDIFGHLPLGGIEEGPFEEQKEQLAANLDDGISPGEKEFPCSIRCRGMMGEFPTLQCGRCLCLFHHVCLGLPKNRIYQNFICSNCNTGPGEMLRPENVFGSRPLSPERMSMEGNTKKQTGQGQKRPEPLLRDYLAKRTMMYRRREILPKIPYLRRYPNANAAGLTRGRLMVDLALKKRDRERGSTVSISSIDMRDTHQVGGSSVIKTTIQLRPVPKLHPISITRGTTGGFLRQLAPQLGHHQPPIVIPKRIRPPRDYGRQMNYIFKLQSDAGQRSGVLVQKGLQQTPETDTVAQHSMRPPNPPRDSRGLMNYNINKRREARERSELQVRNGMQQPPKAGTHAFAQHQMQPTSADTTPKTGAVAQHNVRPQERSEVQVLNGMQQTHETGTHTVAQHQMQLSGSKFTPETVTVAQHSMQPPNPPRDSRGLMNYNINKRRESRERSDVQVRNGMQQPHKTGTHALAQHHMQPTGSPETGAVAQHHVRPRERSEVQVQQPHKTGTHPVAPHQMQPYGLNTTPATGTLVQHPMQPPNPPRDYRGLMNYNINRRKEARERSEVQVRNGMQQPHKTGTHAMAQHLM